MTRGTETGLKQNGFRLKRFIQKVNWADSCMIKIMNKQI